ncbi:MAG: TonB family protein [Chromatiales bacterium]|jgi:protein TonB|nr:TonB family protein [Chromatiales bacterium]
MPGQATATAPPSVPLPWSASAARDRLSSTAFVAALLHGILILGVSFTAADAFRDRPPDSSLEVVLVLTPEADREPPESAVLLAQQNLAGAGNAPAEAPLETALGTRVAAPVLGPVREGAPTEIRAGQRVPTRFSDPFVSASRSPLRLADEGQWDREAALQQSTVPSFTNPVDLVGRIAEANRIPDSRPREIFVSANTRESRIAGYLTAWKRKVEQTGTLNFPTEARRPGTGYPVLEVAIAADGSLRDVIVRNSSGQRSLDQAAVQILRLAAPFAPFPESLAREYDVLRFAYEWRFSEGVGTVRGPGA